MSLLFFTVTDEMDAPPNWRLSAKLLKLFCKKHLQLKPIGASITSTVTLISVDLAKDVFQVAGFTDRLKAVFNRQIKRKDLHGFMVQQLSLIHI